jgi:hypothetical protein
MSFVNLLRRIYSSRRNEESALADKKRHYEEERRLIEKEKSLLAVLETYCQLSGNVVTLDAVLKTIELFDTSYFEWRKKPGNLQMLGDEVERLIDVFQKENARFRAEVLTKEAQQKQSELQQTKEFEDREFIRKLNDIYLTDPLRACKIMKELGHIVCDDDDGDGDGPSVNLTPTPGERS